MVHQIDGRNSGLVRHWTISKPEKGSLYIELTQVVYKMKINFELFYEKMFNFVQKSVVPYETVFYILQGLKAPSDQLLKYLQMIDNQDCLEHIKDFSYNNKLTDLTLEVTCF